MGEKQEVNIQFSDDLYNLVNVMVATQKGKSETKLDGILLLNEHCYSPLRPLPTELITSVSLRKVPEIQDK